MHRNIRRTLAVAIAAALTGPTFGAESNDLDSLRQDVERLKQENAQIRQALDATADMVEAKGESGRNRIGGYGEMHYNNWDAKKELDFHRFVLFFGHEFTDRLRFASELELEHVIASHEAEDPGEVELEQAYVEYDLNPRTAVKGGLFLVPVGILNETHEPPTFYGVERNPVEKNIIPSTWWEGGAAVSGRAGAGLAYDVAVHSGLKLDAGDGYEIREGRQKVAEAPAEDLAYTGRLRWTGMRGVELATTLQYQEDVTQGTDPSAGAATLWEAHAILSRGAFGLRALYARWDLDGSGPKALGADEQSGWYVEPSYRPTRKLGFFARYAEWDNQAGNAADTQKDQTNVGLNYWPHPDVVLKADLQRSSVDGADGFNLGIGYQF